MGKTEAFPSRIVTSFESDRTASTAATDPGPEADVIDSGNAD
jgi:hypothetical protein